MRRHLFNALTLLSLLLCAAVCALWVRSHWRVDDVYCWEQYCFTLGLRHHDLRAMRPAFI